MSVSRCCETDILYRFSNFCFGFCRCFFVIQKESRRCVLNGRDIEIPSE